MQQYFGTKMDDKMVQNKERKEWTIHCLSTHILLIINKENDKKEDFSPKC